MQKNKELQELFNNYKNLSEEQLDRLLGLILKQEKEKLGWLHADNRPRPRRRRE